MCLNGLVVTYAQFCKVKPTLSNTYYTLNHAQIPPLDILYESRDLIGPEAHNPAY